MTILFLGANLLHAQRDSRQFGKPIPPAPVNPQIQAAIAQISAARIQQDITALVGFHNRSTLSSMDKDLPAGQGVLAAADWIQAQYESYSRACGGCLQVKRDTFTQPVSDRVAQPTVLNNIYAILRGNDPAQATRMYLVTGHYDSRDTDILDSHGFAPGANDDASGVAVSLECARVLSKLHLPATLVFVAVPGEEQGLYGSHHLAEFARQQGWQLEGVLNNDIVGGNTTPGDTLQNKHLVRVFSEGIPATATDRQIRLLRMLGGESDSPSRELARSVADVSRTYFPAPANAPAAIHPELIFRLDRYLRGGDHYSFNQFGFPAVRFTEWREDFHHQHQNVRVQDGVQFGDLPQYVDFHYVANVARLNAATLATLASAPGMPQQVAIVTSNLDNNTQLKWQPPVNASTGTLYQVVWRDTDAPNWQYYANAGNAVIMTLPVSKDNVIFGVRSVNAAGYRSQAVFPLPERFFTQPVSK
ncbi:MAG TPA: M20/M25/M40 family metallo-hydrolase [Acidobacteriaceae bacterium]|nr:M20/M25/M40 family metallo-hydrolase [Acidobacteriaceae bacterium]